MANVELPDTYPFAERVPKRGASCATCRFLTKDKKCGNPFYQKAHGSSELGARPRRWYCVAWRPELK